MSGGEYVAVIVIALISALVGTGTGGFIVAWRRDRRQAPLDAEAARKARVEVTTLVEELAERAVTRAKEQLAEQEEEAREELHAQQLEINRLRARVEVLETAMRNGGLVVPPWKIT